MKRSLFALSLSAALLATHAQAQTPVRTESPASEFVYEALGATPSIRLGKAEAKPAPAATTGAREDAMPKSKPAVAEVRSAAERARPQSN